MGWYKLNKIKLQPTIKQVPPKGVTAPSQFIFSFPFALKKVSAYSDPLNKIIPAKNKLQSRIAFYNQSRIVLQSDQLNKKGFLIISKYINDLLQ